MIRLTMTLPKSIFLALFVKSYQVKKELNLFCKKLPFSRVKKKIFLSLSLLLARFLQQFRVYSTLVLEKYFFGEGNNNSFSQLLIFL